MLKMNIKDQMDDDYQKLLPIIKENNDILLHVDDLVEDIKGLHFSLETQVYLLYIYLFTITHHYYVM